LISETLLLLENYDNDPYTKYGLAEWGTESFRTVAIVLGMSYGTRADYKIVSFPV